MQLKVMTFNIQHGINHILHKEYIAGGRAENANLIDLPLMARAVSSCSPDIVALNEVRDKSGAACFDAQVHIIADHAGYPYYYFGKAIDVPNGGPYGNGLISKYPFVSVKTVPIPDPAVKDEAVLYESRSLIKAEIDLPGSDIPLTVLAVHMGLAAAEEKNAVQMLLEQTEPHHPTVLMGDFNITPDKPVLLPLLDVFCDAGALLPEGTYTFPSDAPSRKIDYIMSAGPVHIVKAEVPNIIASDHLPHTALLEL